MCVEWQNVARVLSHRKHLVECDAAAWSCRQKAGEQVALPGLLTLVFNCGTGPLVCPSGQRLPEMGREDGMQDFMRQYAIQNAFA